MGEMSWDGGYYGSWLYGLSNGASLSYAAKNVTYPLNSFSIDLSHAQWNDVSFGSRHSGGPEFAFADGSVRFLSENIELKVYKAVARAKR